MEIQDVLKNHQIDSNEEQWNEDDINKKMSNENAVIHWVASYGTAEEIDVLLEHGALLDLPGELGRTPALISATENNIPVLALLISRGADVGHIDDYGDGIFDLLSPKGANELRKMLEDD